MYQSCFSKTEILKLRESETWKWRRRFPELRITAFDSETLLILSEPSKQIIVVFAVRI